MRAWLEPQPDLDVPRFAYESHLAALASDPPEWPDSTRRISELRVTIEYRSNTVLKRSLSRLGLERLNLDIVDYPGEWLLDLPMLGLDWAAWSRKALASARLPGRTEAAQELLAFVAATDPAAALDEVLAAKGAKVFTDYLQRVRDLDGTTATEGPGRFLMPGDLEGSPLLTFLPLDVAEDTKLRRGSLGTLLSERYEAYKAKVVRPFFRDHFARLDRQIVLVDALAAIDRGPAAVADLERSLADILAIVNPVRNPWLAALTWRRLDRVLFAATKADHLPGAGHERLEAILSGLTERARRRAEVTGAEVRAIALAALRSTREAQVKRGGETHDCIVGVPLPGERLGGTIFDGVRSATVFPGDLPESAEALLAAQAAASVPGGAATAAADVRVLRFRPARIAPDSAIGERAHWPHVRLDRALDFLIGDRLA